jgi:hypothetical protein
MNSSGKGGIRVPLFCEGVSHFPLERTFYSFLQDLSRVDPPTFPRRFLSSNTTPTACTLCRVCYSMPVSMPRAICFALKMEAA